MYFNYLLKMKLLKHGDADFVLQADFGFKL